MNEPMRMKRYFVDVGRDAVQGFATLDLIEDTSGSYFLASDIQAWAGEVMGLADAIDLRPWIDCACETCQENGERLMKLKAKLGEVL